MARASTAVIHRTIQDRFRTLIPDLASGGIDSIVALDTKGRVIARVGDNEKEYGDFIGGAEIIADALRGYLSDDVWGVNGRLQRLAAAPVLSKNRDRIVGAVYVSAETGPALVERLKRNLDVDIALLLRGKVIASSRGPGDLDALPDLISHHLKEIETAKRTQPISMTVGKEELIVVAAPFPGQAGEQQAYYALVGQHPANSGHRDAVRERDLGRSQVGAVPLAAAHGRHVRGDPPRPGLAARGGGDPDPAPAARAAEAGVRRSPQDS